MDTFFSTQKVRGKISHQRPVVSYTEKNYGEPLIFEANKKNRKRPKGLTKIIVVDKKRDPYFMVYEIIPRNKQPKQPGFFFFVLLN